MLTYKMEVYHGKKYEYAYRRAFLEEFGEGVIKSWNHPQGNLSLHERRKLEDRLHCRTFRRLVQRRRAAESRAAEAEKQDRIHRMDRIEASQPHPEHPARNPLPLNWRLRRA